MKKLWPCAPRAIHLHLGAPLSYGMLLAAAAACSGSGCFEACGGGWSALQAARGCCEVRGGRAARGKVFVRRAAAAERCACWRRRGEGEELFEASALI